ncbi:MAG: MFS transporter [Fuerstiella sp.]|nr:MFS transporter [Fuerstiella sp.]MCP4856539.1 MFS transporter [Fuerstiella sp.]
MPNTSETTTSESDTGAPGNSAAASEVRKSTLLTVFVVVFIDLLGFGIVLPLLPRYGAHFNATSMQLGLLMASFSAMQFLFAPMWGALSDRIGRRPVLIVGLLGSTFAYTMFGVATALGRDGVLLGLGALPLLFVTRVAAGIAGATIPTAQAVIADSTGPEGRGKGMALIGAAFGIGFTFGPLIGAACTSGTPSIALSDAQYAAVQKWDESNEVLSAQQLTTLLEVDGILEAADRESISQYLTEPMPQNHVRKELLQPPSALPGYVAAVLSALALLLAIAKLPESRPVAQEEEGVAEPQRGGLWQLGAVFKHLTAGKLSAILAAIFITTFAFAQFESTLSLLTREFGYSSKRNFLLFAYIGAILMVGQGLLVRQMLPRVGEHRMALWGVVLMTLGFVLIALAGNKTLPASSLWYILPIVTIGFSAVTPSLQSLLSQSAADDEQGAVLGTGQSLSSLARILGPYIGIQLLGVSAATPYFAGAGLMVIGGISIAAIRREEHATTPAPHG